LEVHPEQVTFIDGLALDDPIATVYPGVIVVAATAYWSFNERTTELVPLPVLIAVDVEAVTSETVTVEVAPFWRPLTTIPSVLVEGLPQRLPELTNAPTSENGRVGYEYCPLSDKVMGAWPYHAST
jgi:hypothetical protein